MSPALRDRLGRLIALAAFSLAPAGCASVGTFTWIQDLPRSEASVTGPTLVGPGDLLSVKVWNADQFTSSQRVREDGTITLFFAESLRVQGLTTAQIAEEITRRLDGVLVAPRVNVILEEATAEMISVIGEVVRPGRYPLRLAPTVLAALSQASGLTEFAKRDRIFILRDGPEPVRIRVTYEQLTEGADLALGFRLRPGDVVIVG